MNLIVRNLADNFIGLQNDCFCIHVSIIMMMWILLGLWDSPVEGTVLRVHLASAYD